MALTAQHTLLLNTVNQRAMNMLPEFKTHGLWTIFYVFLNPLSSLKVSISDKLTK